jgi:hypothetical protein
MLSFRIDPLHMFFFCSHEVKARFGGCGGQIGFDFGTLPRAGVTGTWFHDAGLC